MKKPEIIAITGSHGTGKSTLSFLLAAHYKKLGKNVKVVQEVARSCPFPINSGMTLEAALWIYYEHMKKELEACRDHDIIICDRTCFDSFIYAEHFKIQAPQSLRESAEYHLKHAYTKVIYVRPDLPLVADSVRPPDQDFQDSIDQLFSSQFQKVATMIPINLLSSDIFNKEKTWMQSCL